MQPPRRPGARHYYDFLPPAGNACGDIWTGLPSGGLLGSSPIIGLVVTPACDLMQRKAETITYLPVVPVRAYFSTLGFLPEIRSRLSGQLQAGGLKIELPWDANSFAPASEDQMETIEVAIVGHMEARQRSEKQMAALNRVRVALSVMRAIANPDLVQIESADLSTLFGSEWEKIKTRIATNSYSTFVHFLPSDEQDPAFAGVPDHSVALFRYPMTAPIEIFDLAQHTPDSGWPAAVDLTARYLPVANSFRGRRPIKALSVQPEFLHDLLSRYTSMYARLGSPDFTPESVKRIASEMDK